MPSKELPEELRGLKRYLLAPNFGKAKMLPDPTGDYLRVEDVATALSDQEGKLRERIVNRIRDYHLRAEAIKPTDVEEAVRLERCANVLNNVIHEHDVALASTPDQDREAQHSGSEVWEPVEWADLEAGDTVRLWAFSGQEGWNREEREVVRREGNIIVLHCSAYNSNTGKEFDYDYDPAKDTYPEKRKPEVRVALNGEDR